MSEQVSHLLPLDANDYRSGPYHVSFAEGEKIACAEIPVTEDNIDEPDEMFSLQIMPDPEGVPNIMPGPMAQTEVTIKSGKHQRICTLTQACHSSLIQLR